MLLERFLKRSSEISALRSAGFVLAAILVAAPASELAAQLPQTRLYSVFPAGAKAGATVDLTVTSGTDLDEIDRLYFNHPGLKAVQKMQEAGGQQQQVANTFVVTIEANVPAGMYEVRTGGRFGVSNPRTFVVGVRDEVQETEPNNVPEQAGALEINSVMNGRVGGTADIDFFKFTGKQGQRVLITCLASRIDSRMSPRIQLFDTAGRRLAYGHNDLRGDPLIDFTAPADGEYLLKVFDFVYRGGNEYVYRLAVHTGPHLDYIMPPAGLPNTTGQFTVYGRNLPGGQPAGVSLDGRPLEKLDVQIAMPADPTTQQIPENLTSNEAGVDGIGYVLQTPAGNSNPLIVQFATGPVTLEQEPNDESAKANKLTVPGEFAGQFQSPGDIDVISFEAKAQEIYYVEVISQRLGTNADPYFVLDRVQVNDKGEETVARITAQDDDATNLGGNDFNTVSDDPVFRFQVPADGTYRLTVRDRYSESRGDPRLVYRLSIRKEQPDFRLVVLPSTPPPQPNQPSLPSPIGLRQGDNFSAVVMAFRRDGFNGVIDVSAEGLPEGVVCKGASIGPNQNSATLIFTAAEDAKEWFGPIRVTGKARVDDPEKVRAVAAAKAAIKPAADQLPKLEQAAQQAGEALAKANEQLAVAKEAAKAKPDDQALAAKVTETEKAVAAATEAAKKADEAKAAGQKQLADAEAAAKQAEAAQAAAAKDVAREARSATIVWTGSQTAASVARVSRSLGLCVLREPAPYQVTTDVFQVEANQSRQILVPVKLIKRQGFDNNVTLTFTGLPNNSNIQIENKPIPKGKDEELLRIFVNNNAVVGTYTLYLKTQGQVAYRRNPEAADRAKAEQEAVNKAAQEAAEAAKQAVAAKDAAVKKAAEDAEALKKAVAAKAEAEKQAAAAAGVLKAATDEKAKADKAAADATAAAKAAAEKAAEAKKAADGAADNTDLAAARDAAAKAAAEAETAAKAATDAQAAAEKKLAEVQQAATKATEAVTVAEKTRVDAEAASKAAAEAQAKAEAAAKQADDTSKAAAAAKAAADKKATDAANASKPNNVNIFPPSTPIVITVKPGPATLAAAVPGGGNLKRGEKLEVKVTVTRINGFEGPVTLTLPLPPGVAGLTAEPVTIPADQKEGVLTIQAAGEATEGQLAHMVVRGEMEFDGKAAVDVPIVVKVNK